MAYAALGVILLAALLLAGRWYASAPPQTLLQVLKWTAVTFAILFGGYLAATGRLGWAMFAAPALFPLFQRLRQMFRMSNTFSRMGQANSGLGTGQTSEVRTRFVRMVLDHDTSEMNGDVLAGRFAGKTLRGLALDDLLALLAEARGDDDSVQVLTAYLERYHGDAWRERAAGAGTGQGASGGGSAGSGAMTREEAYAILGLQPGADAAAIKAAHHKLMSKIHPDHGGSTYLAAKINQAKDLLLD